ncbi:MAG: helix-turn-helix domain-containing protein [Pseudolysinimonas sp.]
MTSARVPGERAGLSLPAVIAAARASLIERGVDGLSMRAVAERLGVAPNAIYSHVANKTALLDAVLDDLLGEIPVAGRDLTPRDGLTAIMRDSFDTLVRHPEFVAATLARQGSGGTNAWRLGDRMLEYFADAGLSDGAARDGLRILLVHMMGAAAFATQFDSSGGLTPPHEIAAVRADYVTGLGWLLDGILG